MRQSPPWLVSGFRLFRSPRRTLNHPTLNEDPAETRPMLTEPEKESAGIAGFFEYELSLGIGKSHCTAGKLRAAPRIPLGPDVVVHVMHHDIRTSWEARASSGRLWVSGWSPSLPSTFWGTLAAPFRLRGLAGRCQAPR